MEQKSFDELWKNSSPLKLANLTLHFLLELCAFFALGYWGVQTGDTTLMKIVLGVGAFALSTTVWGVFRVPGEPGKPVVAVSRPVRLTIEWVVTSAAVLGLAATGQTTLAMVFAVVLVIDYIGLYSDRLFKR